MKNFKDVIEKIENFLEIYLVKKAPFSIPRRIKEIIVKIAPYFSIFGVIVLSLLIILGVFSFIITPLFTPLSFYTKPNITIYFIFSIISLIITLILEALAIPGLFKRKKRGWNYAFYSALFGIIYTILDSGLIGLFSLIIFAVPGLYILFQIREYYK